MSVVIQAPQFDTEAIKVGQPFMLHHASPDVRPQVDVPYDTVVAVLVEHVSPLKLVGISINDKGEKRKHIIGIEDTDKLEITELVAK